MQNTKQKTTWQLPGGKNKQDLHKKNKANLQTEERRTKRPKRKKCPRKLG